MAGPYDITEIQSSDNVGLSRVTINDNFIKIKALVDSIATGISWTENIKDITDISFAIPTEGNRYICNLTSGGWTENYIYQYTSGAWVEIIPTEGLTTYVDDQYKFVVYTGTGWATVGGIVPHNALNGLNLADYQHLTAAQLSGLVGGGSASAYHYHNDNVAVPASFPTYTGRKGQWAIDTTEKLMYFCISTDLWIRWTIETNP